MDVNQTSRVFIHLYDLSQGMAKQLSRGILGKDIEGIWHTGIVVFGKEYYWGSEIYADTPKMTPYGAPYKVIDMGPTQIPKNIFEEFLKDISSKYTPDQYDIFKKNCNNFSNECLEFLTGKPLPEYITGLPNEVLQTPMGRMIAPMIQQMQDNVRLQSKNHHSEFMPSNTNQGSKAEINVEPKEINDVMDLIQFLEETKFSIIDFYADWCGPYIKDLGFYSCNIQKVPEVSEFYSIKSIPFFGFFTEVDLTDSVVGGGNLESKIESFVQSCLSKGLVPKDNNKPNEQILIPSFKRYNAQALKPFQFTSDNLQIPIQKMKEINNELSESSKEFLNDFSLNFNQYITSVSEENAIKLLNFLFENIIDGENIKGNSLPFLDVLKSALLQSSVSELIISNYKEEFERLLRNLLVPQEKLTVQIILIRVICNGLVFEPISDFILGSKINMEILSKVYKNYVLNCSKESITYAYSLLFYNLCYKVYQGTNNSANFDVKEYFDIYLDSKCTVYGEKCLISIYTGLILLAEKFKDELPKELKENFIGKIKINIKSTPEVICIEYLEDLIMMLSK